MSENTQSSLPEWQPTLDSLIVEAARLGVGNVSFRPTKGQVSVICDPGTNTTAFLEAGWVLLCDGSVRKVQDYDTQSAFFAKGYRPPDRKFCTFDSWFESMAARHQAGHTLSSKDNPESHHIGFLDETADFWGALPLPHVKDFIQKNPKHIVVPLLKSPAGRQKLITLGNPEPEGAQDETTPAPGSSPLEGRSATDETAGS